MPTNPDSISSDDALSSIQDLLESTAPAPTAESEKRKAEEAELRKPYPGLGKLTVGVVKILELTDAQIKGLQEVFAEYKGVHVFRTDHQVYAIRECNRIEWKKFQVDVQNATADVYKKMAEKGFADQAIQTAILMYIEEKTAEKLLVFPKFDDETSRREFLLQQVPGEIKTIADAISVALGYGEQMSPLKL